MTGVVERRRPAGYRRMTWTPGDPLRKRERWSKEARAYARRMQRPSVVALIAALTPHLNSKLGYAWVSNETLRAEMGSPNVSSIERAVKLADDLGLIDREIRRAHDKAGHVTSERRIWPAEHAAMTAPIEARQPKKRANAEAAGSPNPESTTITSRIFNGMAPQMRATGRPPPPERSRTLNRPPNGSGVNHDSMAIDRRDVGSQLWKGGRSSPGITGPAARLIEEFAYIGPDCFRDETGEFSDLLEIGRRAWTAMHHGSLSAPDASMVVEHAKDAVRRSWTDHDTKVVAMLQHLEAACRRLGGAPLVIAR